MNDRPKPPRPSRPELDEANRVLREYHERARGERVAGGAHVAEVARKAEEHAAETRSTLEAAMAHMRKQDRLNADQNAVLAMIAREFGFAKRLPSSIAVSLPPPPIEGKARTAPLVPRIGEDARRTRTGMIIMLVITLFEFLDHAITFAAKHF